MWMMKLHYSRRADELFRDNDTIIFTYFRVRRRTAGYIQFIESRYLVLSDLVFVARDRSSERTDFTDPSRAR